MPKEIELFTKEELVFKEKFYKLMDLFLTKNNNLHESIFLKSIYYMQILSLFYSEQIHIFDKKSKSDEILIVIEKIIRIKNLFRTYHNYLEILIYILFILMILEIIFFFIVCYRTFIYSIYSFNKKLIHTLIKIFIFFEFNIILDCCLSNYCFGFDEYNPNFNGEIKCNESNETPIRVISVIFILISIILKYLFDIFYSDIFIFSNSYYSKISCHYDLYMDLIGIINSILMIQSYAFKREIFLVFNLVSSIVMLLYYFKYYYIYYKIDINNLAGIFHTLYAWTSIFCLCFVYIDVKEKGIIYFVLSIVIGFAFINFKNKIENDLFYNHSLTELSNVHQTLYYLNNINKRINNFDECLGDKAFITGLVEVIMREKSKSRIYKIINEEKDEDFENKLKSIFKGAINEPYFRKYILETLFNLFVLVFEDRSDIYLNLSLFYLIYVRNYCKSMYIFQKALKLRLNSLEQFACERLQLKINRVIKQNLKPFSEQSLPLENIDVSMYYKYDTLSHNFFDEISKEIKLSLEFWKEFKKYSLMKNYLIDYNKIFQLTDKIKTTEENVKKMWENLLKIYNGVNEYFYFYNDYIDQIIDDNLKKKELDSLKRKNDTMVENLSTNYYIILFNKDTGIIIANVDKGSEGIIKHCNKRISNIFNYKLSELKDENVTLLMPKLFELEHSEYIKKYFNKGSNKYVEKQDFKTFAKDKYNSIIQIKIGLKLFPILNKNVFMAALVIKESMDDMIILDKDFNIQGMSQKLTKIFNLNEPHFFQRHQVPFYTFCKKFINFYNMFLKNKTTEQNNDIDIVINNNNDNNNITKEKNFGEKESPKIRDNENKINEEHENIQVNENIELEFEIKIPQFIIDYAKICKNKQNQKSYISDEEEENTENKEKNNLNIDNTQNIFESDSDEEQEKEPLIHGTLTGKIINTKKTKKFLYTNMKFKNTDITPITPTPSYTRNTDDAILEDLKDRIINEQERLDHRPKEEKIFIEAIDEYIDLFNKEKFNDLEDLIDLYNKNSSFNEYKFNFAFDKNKFGFNQFFYIVRCIDNQIDDGIMSEQSFGEVNPSSVKYKKEKVEAMKPLFEILKEEQDDIIRSYQSFLKISMENVKFKYMLEAAKKDIDDLSKIHGQKKEEIVEDENASQTSSPGFDNVLVKKNKIEEVKAKLFNSSNNFTTIKYIRTTIILLTLFTIVFALVYFVQISTIINSLEHISTINLYLLQTSFWTTEIVSSFISLKFIFDIKMGHININLNNFDFQPLIDLNLYTIGLKENINTLYDNLTTYLGDIEINIPDFLTNEQLIYLYWDHINISFVNNDFIKDDNNNNESYPAAMDQFLCNCKRFLKINDSEEYLKKISEDISFQWIYNYTTYLIIENGYNSIIPEQLRKLKVMIGIFSEYNNNQKVILIGAIAFFAGLSIIDLIFFFILIRMTNKAMTRLLKKISKIKSDKIEERIKKLDIFNSNLKKFKEKDYSNTPEESKTKSEINTVKNTSKKLLYNRTIKTENSFSDLSTNKSSVDSSFSSGYYLEEKKYIPLRILNEYFIHFFIIIIVFGVFIILIYLYSIETIKDINTFLFIEKYFYGKLITISAEMIEVKCYISQCKNISTFNLEEFKRYSDIDNIIIGLKNFEKLEYYYNNKILLDACGAVINGNFNQISNADCYNDSFVKKGNNTANLLKIIESTISNIYMKDQMKDHNQDYQRADLFKSEDYQIIEHIYYNFIYGVDKVLSEIIKTNLDDYLCNKKIIIIVLIFALILVQLIYFFVFMGIYIPRLIHFINVTRSVIKIIPTFIIMVTQDLEKWIENKYNNNGSF